MRSSSKCSHRCLFIIIWWKNCAAQSHSTFLIHHHTHSHFFAMVWCATQQRMALSSSSNHSTAIIVTHPAFNLHLILSFSLSLKLSLSLFFSLFLYASVVVKFAYDAPLRCLSICMCNGAPDKIHFHFDLSPFDETQVFHLLRVTENAVNNTDAFIQLTEEQLKTNRKRKQLVTTVTHNNRQTRNKRNTHRNLYINTHCIYFLLFSYSRRNGDRPSKQEWDKDWKWRRWWGWRRRRGILSKAFKRSVGKCVFYFFLILMCL